MFLDLLMSQWKLVLIAALMAACGLYRHALLNAEHEIVAIQNQHQLLIAAAKAETKKAQDISTTTAKEINDGIPKLVAKAQANAVENYKRRYAGSGQPGAACGVGSHSGAGHGFYANGLRTDGADPASTFQANGTQITPGQSAGLDASGTCDPRFLNDAAEAAVKLDGWERWRVGNGLAFEK